MAKAGGGGGGGGGKELDAVAAARIAALTPLLQAGVDALLHHLADKRGADAIVSTGTLATDVSQARLRAMEAPRPPPASAGPAGERLPEQHPLRFLAQYLLRHRHEVAGTAAAAPPPTSS